MADKKGFDPKTPRVGLSGRESVFDKRLAELRSTGQMSKPKLSPKAAAKKAMNEFNTPSLDSKLTQVGTDDGHTEIERLAFIDAKSQLLNLRTILGKLATEWRRSRRYKRPFSATIVELDNMEKLEELTPLAADTIFQNFCRIVSTNCREVDIVGRISESRLLIISPETAAPEAIVEAERLKHVIASARFNKIGLNITVTSSFGITSYPECADSPEDLFVTALDAIDAAVSAGGNTVRLAAPSSPEAEVSIEDFSPDPAPQVLPKKPEMAPDLAFPVADISTVVVP